MSADRTLCFIGPFHPDEPRNRVIMRGLRENAVAVVLIQSRSFRARTALDTRPDQRRWEYHSKFWFSLVPRAALENLYMLRALIRHRAKVRSSSGLVILSYGNYCVPTAKVVALILHLPLILEAHNSLYYQRIIGVEDYPERSRYARALFRFDRWTARVCNVYITNCEVYRQRLIRDFGLPAEKFHPVYLGALEPDPLPTPERGHADWPDVLMVSNFKIYHGCELLIRAAACIERDGRSRPRIGLVGEGPTHQRCVDLARDLGLQSVRFYGFLPEAEVRPLLQSAAVVCGTLGASPLNEMDIPTKVCDAAAFGKALVTRDTAAMREAFVHGESAMLCNPDDPAELANAIMNAYGDESLRATLESGIRDVYQRCFSPAAIGRQFLDGIS